MENGDTKKRSGAFKLKEMTPRDPEIDERERREFREVILIHIKKLIDQRIDSTRCILTSLHTISA
jgi:hypothetical protein